MVTLLKTSLDRHSPLRDYVTDEQRAVSFHKNIASLSITISLLSIVQCCTEFASFFPNDVELRGTLADSWGMLIGNSLLEAAIWKIRSKALLGVVL